MLAFGGFCPPPAGDVLRRYQNLPPIGGDDYDDFGPFDGPPPAQGTSPLLWVAIGIAVLIFVGFAILIVSLLDGGDGNGAPPDFSIQIDRINVGDTSIGVGEEVTLPVNEPFEVELTVRSPAALEDVRLEIDGEVEDSLSNPPLTVDGVTRPALTGIVREAGEHSTRVVARLAGTGEERAVQFTIIGEEEGGNGNDDEEIVGTANADVNVRDRPDAEAEVVTVLERGSEVEVSGRTQDNRWLQIVHPGNERNWVVRDAIDLEQGDLGRLPVVTPATATPTPTGTPTQSPTATATETGTPTPTATQAPQANLAVESAATTGTNIGVDVAIINTGPGALASTFITVSLAGVTQNPISALVELPNMNAGQTAVFTFTVPNPITSPTEVTISVDVNNDVAESNEDDNVSTLTLTPTDVPDLAIDEVSQDGGSVVVRITNAGTGTAEGEILVTVQDTETEGEPIVGQVTEEISLAPGEDLEFTIAIDGELPQTARVTVDADNAIAEASEQNNSILAEFQ